MELALNLSTLPSSNNPLLNLIMDNNHPDPLRFCIAAAAQDEPPLQLDLLPNTPVLHGLDVNRAADGDGALSSSPSPNSGASSFQMDFFKSDGAGDHRERGGSDEDDNAASTRKKLRLTKEQSAFLEESFKQHTTLNPKQKVALANELNLRPRQVEVWFQNRRARTKLKQTEVDCEYLKRCCETLTEENRRLQKEVQELRALKSSNPFYMQRPATTLTMCPSCERVATTPPATTAPTALSLATPLHEDHRQPPFKDQAPPTTTTNYN